MLVNHVFGGNDCWWHFSSFLPSLHLSLPPQHPDSPPPPPPSILPSFPILLAARSFRMTVIIVMLLIGTVFLPLPCLPTYRQCLEITDEWFFRVTSRHNDCTHPEIVALCHRSLWYLQNLLAARILCPLSRKQSHNGNWYFCSFILHEHYLY